MLHSRHPSSKRASKKAVKRAPRGARAHFSLKPTGRNPSRGSHSAQGERWVRAALRKMTLEEKLGQMVMIPFFGEFTSPESREFEELARAVEQHHIGGLIVHTRRGALGIERSRAFPTAALIHEMQSRAKIPLLAAADFERGTAMRLVEGTSFPHAMAIAAGGRLQDAYTLGRITALEARAVGAPWIFAPVADVNSDPNNPIINIRSFGEDPERVARFVAAYVHGVEENGGLATAKHFPGHGNTNVDSHMDLPTVSSDPAHLERIELLPFRAAIAAGVSTIMTGHIAVPALEPQPGLPTTFSSRITGELLRRRMGFGGLIVTDDLSMGGVSLRYTTAEAAVRSALAGGDVLLAFAGYQAALAGLREAAESGRLPMARIEDAVTRVLRAKTRLGLQSGARADLAALPLALARPEFAQAAAEMADRGITLLRDDSGMIPLDATRPLRLLLVAISDDPELAPAAAFEEELRWRADALEVRRADARFHPVEKLELPAESEYDVAILALVVRYADRKGSIGLPEAQLAAARRVLASSKPVSVACFGSPYVIARLPEARTWVAAFSTADVAQRAAARAIFGQTAIGGRIPVNVPAGVALGSGIDSPADPMRLVASRGDAGDTRGAQCDAASARIKGWLEGAVARHDFPGGTLAVGLEDHLSVYSCGKFSGERGAAAVKPDTIFDTASLTKPVVTATLAATLTESGQLDVDVPIAHYLPEWAEARRSRPAQADWRAGVTVRNLLTHTSGLPAHRAYFRKLASKRGIVAAALAEPLECEPGTQSIYSDIGFIVLGEVIERLTGRTLDRLAEEQIFGPLGMKDTRFRPSKALLARVSPVTDEMRQPKPLPRGEVHDENAQAMGGVAPHAGVFSTAGDLAIFCQMLLNGGIYAHRRLLRRQTIARFTAASPLSGNTRTMGWMVPTPRSSSGHFFSPRSFGHLGFTGTSMWIDPDKRLFIVLLTNRVNLSREKILELRAELHDEVVEALELTGEARSSRAEERSIATRP